MPPFDLDTAARFGTVPVRMFSLAVAMAVRDKANQLAFNRDSSPVPSLGLMEYCSDGVWYTLEPPPPAFVSAWPSLLRALLSEAGNRFTVRLDACEFTVRAEVVSTFHSWPTTRWRRFVGAAKTPQTSIVNRATLELPILPELFTQANELLRISFDENGLVHFEESEFA